MKYRNNLDLSNVLGISYVLIPLVSFISKNIKKKKVKNEGRPNSFICIETVRKLDSFNFEEETGDKAYQRKRFRTKSSSSFVCKKFNGFWEFNKYVALIFTFIG